MSDFNAVEAEWAKNPHQLPYDRSRYWKSERFPDYFVDAEGKFYTAFRDVLQGATFMRPARNPAEAYASA